MPKTTSENGYENINSTQAVNLSDIPRSRIIKKQKALKLNNGEPLSGAIKKIILQLLIILIVPIIIISIMYGKYNSLNLLNNDDYGSLTISSKYQEVYSNSKLTDVDAKHSNSFAIMESISSWAGETFTEASLYSEYNKKDKAATINSFVGVLEEKLPEYTIGVSTQLGNYALLDAIYQTMSEDNIAIVSMALSEQKGDEDNQEIAFVAVKEINFGLSTISVVTPHGRTDTFSIETFIERTRLSNYKSSINDKVDFAIGFSSANTLITIEK